MEEKRNRKLHTFLKGSVLLVIANIFTKMLNFFLLPLYTEYLSPKELGISDAITNMVTLMFPILLLGLDAAFNAYYYEERTRKHVVKIFNTFRFTLWFTGVIPILLSFFSKEISIVLFGHSEYQLYVIVALFTISFNLWNWPFAIYVKIKGQYSIFALATVIASFLLIGMNILFVVFFKLGAFSLILSNGITQFLLLVFYLIATREPLNFRGFDFAYLRKMLVFSLPLIPASIIHWILTFSDRLMVLWLASESELGVYGIAVRFAVIITVFTNGIQVAYNTFAFDKNKEADAKKHYVAILDMVFVLLMSVAFFTVLFGKEVIEIMTTSQYHEAYKMLPGLLIAQVVLGVNSIIALGLSFSKKTKYTLIATILAAAMNVGFNYFTIPYFGGVGAAYGSLASSFVLMICIYFFSQKFYPCPYHMKKIVGLLLGSLIVLVLGIHLVWYIKIGIFLLYMGIILLTYRETLKSIWDKVKVWYSEKKKRKQQ